MTKINFSGLSHLSVRRRPVYPTLGQGGGQNYDTEKSKQPRKTVFTASLDVTAPSYIPKPQWLDYISFQHPGNQSDNQAIKPGQKIKM